MNSGCYGADISEILLSIKVIDDKGKEKEIKNNEIEFYYRGTDLPKNYIILSARLKGTTSKKKLIEKKQEELIQRKKKSQPSQIKTGGSTFKNINEKKLLTSLNKMNFFRNESYLLDSLDLLQKLKIISSKRSKNWKSFLKELKKVKVKTSGLRAEEIKEKIFNKRLKTIQDKKNDL